MRLFHVHEHVIRHRFASSNLSYRSHSSSTGDPPAVHHFESLHSLTRARLIYKPLAKTVGATYQVARLCVLCVSSFPLW